MTPSLAPVCLFKTFPCVRSKRHRVYWHHVYMCLNMCACCRYTPGRCERTHGDVLDGHTGRREWTHHTATAPRQVNTTTPRHNNTPHHTSVGQAVSENGVLERQSTKKTSVTFVFFLSLRFDRVFCDLTVVFLWFDRVFCGLTVFFVV